MSLDVFDENFINTVNRLMNTKTDCRYIIAAVNAKYFGIECFFSELKYDTQTEDIFLDEENINYIKEYL